MSACAAGTVARSSSGSARTATTGTRSWKNGSRRPRISPTQKPKRGRVGQVRQVERIRTHPSRLRNPIARCAAPRTASPKAVPAPIAAATANVPITSTIGRRLPGSPTFPSRVSPAHPPHPAHQLPAPSSLFSALRHGSRFRDQVVQHSLDLRVRILERTIGPNDVVGPRRFLLGAHLSGESLAGFFAGQPPCHQSCFLRFDAAEGGNNLVEVTGVRGLVQQGNIHN